MKLPSWLVTLASLSLIVALLSGLVILLDILLRKHQMMAVMKWVWPITALYMGPFAIWAYWAMERSPGSPHRKEGEQRQSQQAFWQVVFKGVTHCSAGCTLGDIIGEWVIFVLGITIAGIALWPEYITDYLLVYALGIIFQYFAIAPMRRLNVKDGLFAAIKADTLSLMAFEVGLFWMDGILFVCPLPPSIAPG